MAIALQLIALAVALEPDIANWINANNITDAQLAEWSNSAHQSVKDLAATIAAKKAQQA